MCVCIYIHIGSERASEREGERGREKERESEGARGWGREGGREGERKREQEKERRENAHLNVKLVVAQIERGVDELKWLEINGNLRHCKRRSKAGNIFSAHMYDARRRLT